MVKTGWLNKTSRENVGKVIQTLTEASWIKSNQSVVPIYIYTCKDTEESISLKIFSKIVFGNILTDEFLLFF